MAGPARPARVTMPITRQTPTAHHHPARSTALAVLVSLVLGAPACGTDTGPTETDTAETVGGDDARRAVAAAIGREVVLPRLRAFVERAEALVPAVDAWHSAESSSDGAATAELAPARLAWNDAIDLWQELELFQFGPAGTMGQVAGGESLRARIYAWPLTSPCRVDQETVAGALFDPAALASAPANVRGLAALEYLLFSESTENACPPSGAINLDGSWAALSAEDVRSRRATYAAAIARDLLASATALRDAWEPAAGDFLGELAEAGERTTYPSAQAALNAISDALYYLDKETKDMKLAGPLGIIGCASETCPALVESRYAGRSASHVVRNLVAFQHAYFGGDPLAAPDALGFDDLLEAAGASALASDFALKIDAALTAAAAIDDPLEATLAADEPRVRAAYTALAELNRLTKTDLLSVLDLELPERAEGDND